MPRLLGKDTSTGGGGASQTPAGSRSPLLPLRSISSPALSFRTTDTSAQPHQLVTPVMRAAEQLQHARQQQQQRSPLPLATSVIAEQPSDWARLQQQRSEQRSLQRAASQRASGAATPIGSGSDPLLDDADDQEPPPSADDKIDEAAIPPFQPPSQQPSPEPPARPPADALADQQQQLTLSQQQHKQQLEDDAREEMNEAKYAEATESAGSSAMQIDSSEPAAPARVTSFSSLFSPCGSASQSSQTNSTLPSLSQLDMGGSQELDDALSQSQSQSQSQMLSQTLDSTPPLGQRSGGASSMHLAAFTSDNSSSKLAFHAAEPPASSRTGSQPSRGIAAMVSDINQKHFRKQQHKQGNKPLLAVNKSAPRYTPPAPQFDGTQWQSTPPLQQQQQQPPKQQKQQQQQQQQQPPLQQQPNQQLPSQPQQPHRPVQPVQPPQQQPLVRSQSAVISNEASFSFSQPAMSSPLAPSGESAAAGSGLPKNLAHRSLPPQQAAPPAKRKPSFSRTEIKAQMQEEYRAMYPGLVQNWGCMRTMRIPELRVIMAGQGEPYSKFTRTEMMNKLLPLAQAGKLKPPAAATAGAPAAGSNGAKQKTPAGAAAAAGGGASERFSLTQIPEEDDSPEGEPEATSLSQGSAKRLKTTHSYTSAQQWQHLAAQRSNSNIPAVTASAPAQQSALASASADLDLAARSAAQQPWASAPLVAHGEHFSRPNCALSPFILQAGTELVVSVHEYLRFRCAHQFAIDKLAQFKSDAVNPRGHRPTLIQLGGSSGLARARVSSLLPVIEADFYARNEHANYPPPTPWCALTMQIQQDDQQAAAAAAATPAAPSVTICYLDGNWMRSDQEPHTRQQLCTLNTAPYLFEASFFEKRMAQEWSVGDLFEATLLQRGVQADPGEEAAAAEPALQLGEVRRFGRIIDIKAQPATKLNGASLDHSPYRCLHVLWLTPMQDSADTFVIDLWNQDIRTMSPWEVQPAPAGIRLATCLPPLQIKPKTASELDRAITSTLNKLYQLVWRVLWLPPTENGSQRYFSALLGTPINCLAHVREQFLKVVERQSLRLYSEWSLFESDLRELIHQLHSSLHAHLDAHDGDDVSALIPQLVRCADEALLPLPPHEANAYADAAATMQRTAAEELLALQWRQQCPAAAGQVLAAIILVIETALLSNPTWVDSFGQLHISPAPSGVAVAPQASRLKMPSYEKLSQLLQDNK